MLTEQDRAAIRMICDDEFDRSIERERIAEHFLRLGQERMRERAFNAIDSVQSRTLSGYVAIEDVKDAIRALKVE